LEYSEKSNGSRINFTARFNGCAEGGTKTATGDASFILSGLKAKQSPAMLEVSLYACPLQRSMSKSFIFSMMKTLWLGLPEDGSSTFFRNVGGLLPDYKRKLMFKFILIL
jgi:hypothetical protein